MKVYQSSVPLERLIQSAIKSVDGHEALFKEIVADKNPVQNLYPLNSLIFWVDIEVTLMKCYDREHN
jgi:hypothetical protein